MPFQNRSGETPVPGIARVSRNAASSGATRSPCRATNPSASVSRSAVELVMIVLSPGDRIVILVIPLPAGPGAWRFQGSSPIGLAASSEMLHLRTGSWLQAASPHAASGRLSPYVGPNRAPEMQIPCQSGDWQGIRRYVRASGGRAEVGCEGRHPCGQRVLRAQSAFDSGTSTRSERSSLGSRSSSSPAAEPMSSKSSWMSNSASASASAASSWIDLPEA